MGNVKFKLKKSGVKALLKSDEMLNMTEEYAESYPGEKKPFIGFDRAKTMVYEKGEENDRN